MAQSFELAWLQREQGFRHDPTLAGAVADHLATLTRHLAGTFWELDSAPEAIRR